MTPKIWKARIKRINYTSIDGVTNDYLTEGIWYDLVWKDRNEPSGNCHFIIVDDEGTELFCLEEGCAHLSGGDWELKEFSDYDDDDDDNDSN